MNESKQKIALFIYADNAPANKFEDVLSEVAKYSVVTIRKAYGNWKAPSLKPWEELLHEFAIQPVQQYDLTKGKNASDIALVIDAMAVMYTKDIDVMCFVSSGCDFTPMVTRALAEGTLQYIYFELNSLDELIDNYDESNEPFTKGIRDPDKPTAYKIHINVNCAGEVFTKLELMGINGANLFMNADGVALDVANSINYHPRVSYLRDMRFPRSEI
jgi:uncharacterized LabA/DUF88 family protein